MTTRRSMTAAQRAEKVADLDAAISAIALRLAAMRKERARVRHIDRQIAYARKQRIEEKGGA